jgi:hypothetical protein
MHRMALLPVLLLLAAVGAAGTVYGLMAAPCKPCPRNMITDGLTKVNSSDACINPDGFGYASEGASR